MVDAGEVVKDVGPTVVGFLEESAGVKSSSRLSVFLVLGLIAVVVAVYAVYVLRGTPNQWVCGTFAGVITALCGAGALLHANRNE